MGAFLQAANGLLGGLIIAVNIDGYLAQLRRVTVTLYGENSAAGQAGLAMMTPSLVYFTIATSVVISLIARAAGAGASPTRSFRCYFRVCFPPMAC